MSRTVLITGAAGFIGPSVVLHFLLNTDFNIVVLDKLTYAAVVDAAGRPLSLELALAEARQTDPRVDSRYTFLEGDICDPKVLDIVREHKVSWLINLAAESHVDRSLLSGHVPDFLNTEVVGTMNLLEIIAEVNNPANNTSPQIERALFVSTDEVYGSIDRLTGCEGEAWFSLARNEAAVLEHIHNSRFVEQQALRPGSPYAGTKAASELLVYAYGNSCRDAEGRSFIPALVTRCVNNFGPYQYPEKLIPLATLTLLEPNAGSCARRIPVYDNGLAAREWISAAEHARSIHYVLERGQPGETYNIGCGQRCLNRTMLQMIFDSVKELGVEIPFRNLEEACFNASGVRPGHDLAYGVNYDKLCALGWEPASESLRNQIQETVRWYHTNREWWEPVWRSADFDAYWSRKYRQVLQERGHLPFSF